jgi:sugar phosphate isomerase/epimerase
MPIKTSPVSGRKGVVLGTVAPIGYEEFASPEWLASLRRLGCSVVQAYRNQAVPVTTRQMVEHILAGGMPCDSLHGVYGGRLDPSSPNEDDRQYTVRALKREGTLVRELGGSLVVVHCSPLMHEPVAVSAEEYAARDGQLRKSIAELGPFGATVGVWYAFENLPGYHPMGSDVGRLAEMLRQVGAPHTGMCFDTGHANMTGDVILAIAAAREQILYVHLCDNDGLADQHLMPGRGTLEMDDVAAGLRAAGYSGTVMLEVFQPADAMAEFVRDGYADRFARFLRIANEGGEAKL